ncbi:kinesin-like protein, partial [Spiromyces aspiralis]
AEPAKPSVAPWNNVAAKPAPKKSLAEIQKEEENARRLQQQKQGANTDSKFSAKSFRKQTPTRYADLLASDDSHTSSLVFNSPELNAPASVIANAWKTPGVAGSVVRLSPKQPTTQAPQNYSSTAARANINGASQQKDAKRDSASSGNHEPSLQFLAWCRAKLRGLRGINVDEFIQVLLTFPLNPPKSSLEIIAEQVYAYSKDLNGRQFAEEFVKKRKEDAKGTFKAPSSLVSNGNAKSPRTSSNEFQVVGKKGRPAHT